MEENERFISRLLKETHESEIFTIKEHDNPNNTFIGKVFKQGHHIREREILKLIKLSKGEGKDYLPKIREIEENINFPNVNEMYNPNDYILLENILGETLFFYFYQRPQYFIENCVKLVTIKLLKALKICHDNGIYHKKIEPEHIMLDKDGEPVIIGFGNAEILNMNNNISNNITSINVLIKKDLRDLAILIIKMLSGGQIFIKIIRGEPKFSLQENEPRNKDLNTIINMINYRRNGNEINQKNLKLLKIFLQKLFSFRRIEELLGEEWLKLNQDEIIKAKEELIKDLENRRREVPEILDFEMNISGVLDNNESSEYHKVFRFSDNTRGIANDERIKFKSEENSFRKINCPPLVFRPGSVLLNLKSDLNDESKILFKFFNKLFWKIKEQYKNICIQEIKNYVAFTVDFYLTEGNENNENDIDNNDDCEEEEEKEEQNNEILSLRVEICSYEVNNYNNYYYLLIDRISGDEFFYFKKLDNIKKMMNNIFKREQS